MELTEENKDDLRGLVNIAAIAIGVYSAGRLLAHAKELGAPPWQLLLFEFVLLIWLFASGCIQVGTRFKPAYDVYPWMRKTLLPLYMALAFPAIQVVVLAVRLVMLFF